MSKFREPGNVREDLDLTAEFCASIAENGVRVPLLITTGADGGFRVIEGHRRLAAAVKAGLPEVPYDLDGERAADEAGQYLDMVTANSGAYRKNFTALEEATALFAAHEAGATRTRIRKTTGRRADQVKTALAAGSLSMSTREQVAGLDLDEQLTLDELAILAEFEDDPEAMDELMRAITYHYPLVHAAERIRQDRAEAAEHQRIRGELEAAGCPVNEELPVARCPKPSATGALPGCCAMTRSGLAMNATATGAASSTATDSAAITVASRQV